MRYMEEYDAWFDDVFRKMTRGIEEHNFRHFNQSMGIMIYNKEHYKQEMKKRRMIPYDTMEELAEQWDNQNPHRDYNNLSPKALDVIRSLRLSADKHGNLRLGGLAIEALQELGVIPSADRTPEHQPLEGGFG